MSDRDPDDVVDEWHEDPDEDTGLLQYLCDEFDWTEEQAKSWILTGKRPVAE